MSPRVGQARKRDRNEKPICDALQAVGCKVFKHGGVGEPDIFVLFQGRFYAAELKAPGGKLTPAQMQAGAGVLWPVWTTPEQALAGIGVK